MKCHYDVMELSMTCSTDEVKKQYKKLALKWHPDRNPDNAEAATETFKLISAAYGVLSDQQERKWYDDHRESILRGGDGTGGDDNEDGQVINVWKYFNTSCYSTVDDPSEHGFYAVYGSLFDSINRQEDEKTTPNEKDSSKKGKISIAVPVFGDSDTSNSELLQFYKHWENFATTLNFSWEDKYHVLEAPNRQVRRAMEKENLKLRDEARREFNSQVRSLASYVKKRDKRYLLIELENKQRREEQERAKAESKLLEQARRKEIREQFLLNKDEREEKEREQERAKERAGAFLLVECESDEEYVTVNALDGGDDDEEEALQEKIRRLKMQDQGSSQVEENEDRGKMMMKKKKKKKKTRPPQSGGSQEIRNTATGEDLLEDLSEFSYTKSSVSEVVFTWPSQGGRQKGASSKGKLDEAAKIDITQPAAIAVAPASDSNVVVEDVSSDDNDEDDGDDGLSCTACSKTFATAVQLSQHLASKPHRQKIKEFAKKKKKSTFVVNKES